MLRDKIRDALALCGVVTNTSTLDVLQWVMLEDRHRFGTSHVARVLMWVDENPDRAASHKQIGDECGTSRRSVRHALIQNLRAGRIERTTHTRGAHPNYSYRVTV